MSGTWWKRAPIAQKLAQIDGGIECGMTARQIAIACGSGTIAVNVRNTANRYGRHLAESKIDAGYDAATLYQAKLRKARKKREAFIAGEAVDFWRDHREATEEVAELVLE